MADGERGYRGRALLAASNGVELPVYVDLFAVADSWHGSGTAGKVAVSMVEGVAESATIVLLLPSRRQGEVLLANLRDRGGSVVFDLVGVGRAPFDATRQLPTPYVPPTQPPVVYHPPSSYPPSMYPQPTIYVVMPPNRKTSGMAIAGLVFGILAMLSCGFFSLIGAPLSINAYIETRKGAVAGDGMAFAGLILNGLCVAGWGLFWLYVLLGSTMD